MIIVLSHIINFTFSGVPYVCYVTEYIAFLHPHVFLLYERAINWMLLISSCLVVSVIL